MQVIILSDAYAQSCDMDIIPLFFHRLMLLRYRRASCLIYISDTTFKGFSNTNLILTLDRTGLTAHVSYIPSGVTGMHTARGDNYELHL